MKNFKYIAIAGICLLMFSCKKADYVRYTGVARLQFGPEFQWRYFAPYAYNDTLKQLTFFYDATTVVSDTVYFDIYSIGHETNQDRSFTLKQEQVPGAYNAIPGQHYKAFNDPETSKNYVIKASQSHSLVPVVLIRDNSLKTNSAVLKLSIVEDQNFKFGQEQFLWRKLIFTDRLSRPNAWTDAYATNTFGKYSMVKHKFMIDSTGQKWDQDFLVKIAGDSSEQAYWISLVKEALIAYNKAHPTAPLTDEAGELVIIP
ncbi:DUF4843 domain-containing protein [Pedobacter frigoris]|uniref:DUF4843 domain-containing protein n=1 Tax=Pedobacter frigoris TaxID=2571272 RepID=A0A4U1CNR5_9SPHI|nr:DUF4843 domain-containing protein [Pedobacter frigoris]TKC09154.1 DUF4843 domain-containing protein [Pedobacter frigoris]